MDYSPLWRNLEAADSNVPAPSRIDQTIALDSRKPVPSKRPADVLQVLESGVPAIEDNVVGVQPSLLGRCEHISEVLVLVLASEWTTWSHRLVVDAKVEWNQLVPICPECRDEVG